MVHLYVIEPHPQSPDVSPYTGEVWEGTYSTKPQPMTYEERVSDAGDMQLNITGNQLLLIDDLTPGQRNNPVWCTYGPCPNCAYLIGSDGIIKKVQTWVDVDEMKKAVDGLLQ